MFHQWVEMSKQSGNISKNKKEMIEGSINYICLNNENVPPLKWRLILKRFERFTSFKPTLSGYAGCNLTVVAGIQNIYLFAIWKEENSLYIS